jgi:valyl-tRNA synthetase
MNNKFDTRYSPEKIESKWYESWVKNDLFKWNNSSNKKTFSIQLPPPNVTGSLHMGHAYQQTLMDILIRFNKMIGNDINWIVGTDHAGIATQIVVERQLEKKGINSKKLNREDFIKKIWDWKNESGNTILNQMQRIGVAANWNFADEKNNSQGYFTMDNSLNSCVMEAFVKLYNDGLIYKGKRLVNWDIKLQTALSDLEVESIEKQSNIWTILYEFKNETGGLEIATTRPETLLGDSAVAVNPNDKRFKQHIGKEVKVPIINKFVKIIGDEYVDEEFGTGCLKITPAHDFNDFELGKKHNLEFINIFRKNGTIISSISELNQMDRFDARKKILQLLKKNNLLISSKKYVTKLPYSSRTNTLIEPILTEQWFLKMDNLASKAISKVKSGDIKFFPKNWENTYFNWLNNIQDWCISRQLVWGHRIPVWYDKSGNIYCAKNKNELLELCLSKNIDFNELFQESDVLDTWFSSALVPFSTLGWPNFIDDYKKLIPSSVLITGFDIIFFWVSRMIMMSLYFTNTIPFKHIYINSIIRDADGQKMSKSKGNTLDPLDIIDGIDLDSLIEKSTKGILIDSHKLKIEKYLKKNFNSGIKPYGADALRFTFAAQASLSRTLNFEIDRCEGYRNFCNKLWNASRFLILQIDSFEKFNYISQEELLSSSNLNDSHHWILTRLDETIQSYSNSIQSYRFDLAANKLYQFIWYEFCDWFIETAKYNIDLLKGHDDPEHNFHINFLIYIQNNILKLCHPIIPFITEEIWQQIQNKLNFKSKSFLINLCIKPTGFKSSTKNVSNYQLFQKITQSIRIERNLLKVPANKKIKIIFFKQSDFLNNYIDIIKSFVKCDSHMFLNDVKNVDSKLKVFSSENIQYSIDYHIDIKSVKRDKEKKLQILNKRRESLESKLNNQQFITKAPDNIVKASKNELKNIQNEILEVKKALDSL